MSREELLNRRSFLRLVALTSAGAPMLLRAESRRPRPSNRIAMAFIGTGWMGTGNLTAFLSKPEVQVVAVCDVDANHRGDAKRLVDQKYGNADCAEYVDFQEMLDRGDLDAVCVSTPDHWHALAGIAALQAGLDVYGEKPLTYRLAEGRALCNAVQRYGRIWQTGSVLRSRAHFHRACMLVRNGRIGKVSRVTVCLPSGFSDIPGNKDKTQFTQPPPELDYRRWLGPAPEAPYCPARVHINWRWNLDYGGGMLMDFIGHHGDIALWGLGREHTGPVEIEAVGNRPTGLWNAPEHFSGKFVYDDGLVLEITSEGRPGTTWFGEHGQVFVTHEAIEVLPKALEWEQVRPEEQQLVFSNDHYQNFINAFVSRAPTIAPCEPAHRAASLGHLCGISMKLGRKVRWNPNVERFVNDTDADRLLSRPYSGPLVLNA